VKSSWKECFIAAVVARHGRIVINVRHSAQTLVSVMAYHSFGGEVEASNTPTIRRLTPSCRHQLPRIAPLWADSADQGKNIGQGSVMSGMMMSSPGWPGSSFMSSSASQR
jgi:hypothetical protein